MSVVAPLVDRVSVSLCAYLVNEDPIVVVSPDADSHAGLDPYSTIALDRGFALVGVFTVPGVAITFTDAVADAVIRLIVVGLVPKNVTLTDSHGPTGTTV